MRIRCACEIFINKKSWNRRQDMRALLLDAIRKISMAVFSLAAFMSVAQAQNYPTRPIKIVVAGPSGGGTDFLARLVADKLAKEFQQSVIVENRPGASGLIGTKYVRQAQPDGYTLIMGHAATHAILPLIHTDPTYDPIKDFTPISLIATAPEVLVVPAKSPIKTFADLLRLAKAKPSAATYGTPGIGQPQHILALRVMKQAGINMLHVPYNGSSPALTDLLGGRLTSMFVTPAAVMPFIHSGKIRALAVSSQTRSKIMPDVPTLEEAGLTGLYQVGWFGLFGPAHMPKPVVGTLSQAVMKIMADPAIRKQISASYMEPEGSTPEQFAAFQAAEVAKFRKIVADANVKIN
ncbi:tripartite tricarboxylate transporter substrate binding protein [Paralcaligenes sp. KSB-10]|uniref:Bug family tripartite tricarboxylate transporter substrate binding protein n=1 Tax=Paralcaligenes sp. KSB-10 TaxID=2901142 RepID=UPI001E3C0F60|nr:tripartite tricarboxylate transporter substrate binding protein [Paralcaligenes sp. KSB-10]UHL65258.1 tripartite tricarboxylate transporter substrate binding protein [Paralcaligenes sp. KSB-10]